MKTKSRVKLRTLGLYSGLKLAWLGFLALWLLQSGCATSQKLPSGAGAPPPQNAVVLMRLAVNMDGQPADPFSGRTKFVFTIVNRDKESGARFARPAPVQDENFRREGWAYLLLEPGTYEIAAGKLITYETMTWSTNAQAAARSPVPHTITWLFRDPHAGIGPYRLYVPPHGHLLYAGSFKAQLNTGPRSPASQTRLEFEPEAAARVASGEFNAFGPLMLAQLLPTNGLASTRSFLQLGHIGLATSAPEKFEPPHWSERAAVDYLEAAIVPGAPGAVGAFVLGYDLAAAPFAALAGSIEGKATKKKWRPCIDALGEEFASCHVAEMLQTTLLKTLRTNGVTDVSVLAEKDNASSTNRQGTFLRADIRKVKLVQGAKRELVATQSALRFRIMDSNAEHCLYDHDFFVNSEFNEMKAYQGEAGRTLFRKQMEDAMNSAVEQFVHDLLSACPDKGKTEQADN